MKIRKVNFARSQHASTVVTNIPTIKSEKSDNFNETVGQSQLRTIIKKIGFKLQSLIKSTPHLFSKFLIRLKSKLINLNVMSFTARNRPGFLSSKTAAREETQDILHSKKKLSKFPVNKTKKYIVLAIVILAISLGFKTLVGRTGRTQADDSRVEIQDAKAHTDINREFNFPLKDSQGNEVSNIKYVIKSADLFDEIVVKGQKAKAVKGRTFLILSVKVSNEYNQAIEISTRDYVRLIRNGNEEEKLAPDIHNDPVEVQAISTKSTRIGFPINDSDKDLKLQVGEITSDKEIIELNLI